MWTKYCITHDHWAFVIIINIAESFGDTAAEIKQVRLRIFGFRIEIIVEDERRPTVGIDMITGIRRLHLFRG